MKLYIEHIERRDWRSINAYIHAVCGPHMTGILTQRSFIVRALDKKDPCTGFRFWETQQRDGINREKKGLQFESFSHKELVVWET